MKRKNSLQQKHVVSIALAVIMLLLVNLGVKAREPLATAYTIEDLGSFGDETRANDINDSGQVVGYWHVASTASAHAFRFTDGVGLVDLNQIANEHNAYSTGINNSGQVSGIADRSGGGGGYHVFRYTDGIGLVDLGSLPGYRFSFIGAINDSGQVVGYAYGATNGPDVIRAFRFTNGVGMQNIGTLGRGSTALSINNFGQVVGFSEVATTPANDEWNPGHAFLYTDCMGMQDLNNLIDPSLGWELRQASAINDKRQIVGFGEHIGSGLHAFLYTDGAVQDLGTFPGGGISYALDINDKGDVVGAAYLDPTGAGNFRAMLYTRSRGMQNLNDLIDPSLGWVLRRATGINERGQIAGWGYLNGLEHAFRLTPINPDRESR